MIGRARKSVPLPHFPLRRLALCLDCDECFEFGSATCPACGSETLASLARFLAPMTGLHRALKGDRRNGVIPGLDRKAARQLLIVARDRAKLYEYLKRAFSGNPTVEVVLDRRAGERRGGAQAIARIPERRRRERRRTDLTSELRALGWAIVVLDVARDLEPGHGAGARERHAD
jgi:hypothetical protein